eukprot:1154334-Pelagomonas_calceolata.AAC.3
MAQRVVKLPYQRVRGKLVWVWWVSGSTRPQGTRVMSSVFDFNGTFGRGKFVRILHRVGMELSCKLGRLLRWIWRFWMFTKLPGWSCAASQFFITSHTAEHPTRGKNGWSIWVGRARSNQDSIGTAGVAPSLIRNKVKLCVEIETNECEDAIAKHQAIQGNDTPAETTYSLKATLFMTPPGLPPQRRKLPKPMHVHQNARTHMPSS